jgi:glycosyltransferase involved in cell wall biosynthesis
MDVGLMPIPDIDWARGKCSFKMIQYMACAVPAVVSPVGMNCDILALGQVGLPAAHEDDWLEALELLYTQQGLAQTIGAEGRRIAEAHFSRSVVAGQLAALFQQVAAI